MNKRILSVFLTICMVVGLFPSLVNAEDITIVIPPFIDQPETPVSEIIKRMEEDIPKVPDGVVTPYGTEGNITLLEKSELFINTPNGLTGTYKLSDSLRFTAASGLDLSGLKFVQSVGFDPTGCGKKDCIAVMGFKPNANNSNGALHVFIYNLESKRLLKTYVLDDGYMGWVATKLDTVDANNFFSITAGDYNGDGRDSLVIYDGIFRGSGDLGLKEIVFDGTNWKDPVNVSVTRSRNELFNPTYMKSSLKSSWDPGNKLHREGLSERRQHSLSGFYSDPRRSHRAERDERHRRTEGAEPGDRHYGGKRLYDYGVERRHRRYRRRRRNGDCCGRLFGRDLQLGFDPV